MFGVHHQQGVVVAGQLQLMIELLPGFGGHIVFAKVRVRQIGVSKKAFGRFGE